MLGRLREFEIVDDIEVADVIIVNTCGFIESAKSESISTILDAHNMRKENSILVVTGCLTQRYQEELSLEFKDEVDIFTGVGDYHKIDELIAKRESRFSPSTFLADEESRVITGSNYHAYIKISEGCNQSCSFCAIPTFKGKLKSRSLESIKKEVLSLVKNGYFDFTFISQDSSSYLRDFSNSDGLIDLIDTVESIDGVKSARILYLYPSTTSKKLIDKIFDSKLFQNYFDIPIQHISDKMLKVMKRGMGEDELKELLSYMKRDDSFIRTSFIVGHPKESEEDFKAIISYIEEFGFDKINIFAYSDEEQTSSYEMNEKLSSEEIEERINTLEEVVEDVLESKLRAFIGESFDVVIDGESDEHEYLLSARALKFAPDIDWEILINDSSIENLNYQGDIYRVKITDIAGDKLVAEVISKTDGK
jgi:ribosomal protein S12 methylthiotransferase RimO